MLIAYTPTIFQSASSEDLLQLQALSFPFLGLQANLWRQLHHRQ